MLNLQVMKRKFEGDKESVNSRLLKGLTLRVEWSCEMVVCKLYYQVVENKYEI